MSKQPLCIVTNKGNVVPTSWLTAYATKASGDESSRQLETGTGKAVDQVGQDGLVRPLYDLHTLAGLPEMNTWHMVCSEARAHDAAGLGFYFKGEDDAHEAERDQLQEFFNTSTFGRPFEDLLQDIEYDFVTLGCLALEVVREDYSPDGLPAMLAHIPAQTVQAHKTGKLFCQTIGIKKRWFKTFGHDKDVDYETGYEYELGSLDPDRRATEIIWQVARGGRSKFYGLADVIPAVGSIEGLSLAKTYNLSFFRNYGIPSFAVYITGDYDLGSLIRVSKESDGTGTLGEIYDETNDGHTIVNFEYPVVTQVREHLSKLTKMPHAPLLLAVPAASPDSKVEVKFEKLATDVKDASFRMYRKDERDEILVAHSVPPYRVGLAETGSLGGNTANASDKMYRELTIKPRRKALETLLNYYIIRQGFGITAWLIRLNELDIAGTEQDKEYADFLFKRAAMTPNDLVRMLGSRFNLETSDHPAMDLHYLNGKPVDMDSGANGDAEAQKSFKTAVKEFQDQLAQVATKGSRDE